jgi:hypothetical protein
MNSSERLLPPGLGLAPQALAGKTMKAVGTKHGSFAAGATVTTDLGRRRSPRQQRRL